MLGTEEKERRKDRKGEEKDIQGKGMEYRVEKNK